MKERKTIIFKDSATHRHYTKRALAALLKKKWIVSPFGYLPQEFDNKKVKTKTSDGLFLMWGGSMNADDRLYYATNPNGGFIIKTNNNKELLSLFGFSEKPEVHKIDKVNLFF